MQRLEYNRPTMSRIHAGSLFDSIYKKTKVDEILEAEHPFGPGSISMTERGRAMFYGKFDRVLGVQSFRCGDYNYEQFIVPEWKRFVELALRKGGPTGREQNNFPLFIK